jgi:hypothetical protein
VRPLVSACDYNYHTGLSSLPCLPVSAFRIGK